MRRLAGALLLLLPWLSGAPAAAQDQESLLRALRQGTAGERRAAAERLGAVGDQAAATRLAEALRDPDPDVREVAADAMWAIWHRSGDPAVDARLREGMELMEAQRLPEAVAVFSDVIRLAPAFAEGWNKRATAYYLMGQWDRSLADCEEVVRRNPIHYGALAGFGLNYLQKDDLSRAAEAFERALKVNPNLTGIESLLEQVRETLRQRKQGTVKATPPSPQEVS